VTKKPEVLLSIVRGFKIRQLILQEKLEGWNFMGW